MTMTPTDLELLSIAEAAALARVSEETIRAWINQGMRATPTGSIGRRGPRNYLIFRAWLVEWMTELAEREQRRLRVQRQAQTTGATTRKRRAAAPADNPLGPCPKPEGA